jgi:hypothetical protein
MLRRSGKRGVNGATEQPGHDRDLDHARSRIDGRITRASDDQKIATRV